MEHTIHRRSDKMTKRGNRLATELLLDSICSDFPGVPATTMSRGISGSFWRQRLLENVEARRRAQLDARWNKVQAIGRERNAICG